MKKIKFKKRLYIVALRTPVGLRTGIIFGIITLFNILGLTSQDIGFWAFEGILLAVAMIVFLAAMYPVAFGFYDWWKSEPEKKKIPITQTYIDRPDGKRVKRVHILYIDGDEKLCDCCDKKKECASIRMLDGNISIICQECLQDMADEFNRSDDE